MQVLDPKTGEVREVDGPAAEAEFRAGRIQLPTGTDVPLSDAQGKFSGYYKPEVVSEAIRDGVLRFASKGEINQHIAEGQPVQAFAEAALDNLVLPGMYDLPARGLGADMDMVNARRKTGAGTAGAVTGFGAGLFLPGANALKAGTAAEKLTARLLPTTMLEVAQRGVSEAAEKALGGIVENAAARRALSQAAGHVVPGAAVGMLGTLDEAALGNTEASVENVLGGIGAGGLIGMTMGGILGRITAGRAADDGRRVIGGAAGAAERVPGQLNAAELTAALEAQGQEVDAAGMQKWFPRLMARLSSGATGVAEADVAKVLSPAGQKVVLQGERARGEAVDALGSIIDAMEENHAKFDLDAARVSDPVLNSIPKGIGDIAIRNGADSLRTVRDNIAAMVKNAANYGKTTEQMSTLFQPILNRLAQAEKKILANVPDAAGVVERNTKLEKDLVTNAVAGGKKAAKQAQANGLPKVGAGFARNVFDEGENVLKAAKNEEGVIQNLAEVQLAGRSEVLNEITEHAPDYSYVRQKKVQPFDSGTYGPVKAPVVPELSLADQIHAVATKLGGEGEKVKFSEVAGKFKGKNIARADFDAAMAELESRGDIYVSPKTKTGKNPVLSVLNPHVPAKAPKVDFAPDKALAEFLGVPDAEGWLQKLVRGEYDGPRTPALEAFEERVMQLKADIPELDVSDLGKAAQWGVPAGGSAADIVLIDFGDRLKKDVANFTAPRARRVPSVPGAWSDDKVREVLATRLITTGGREANPTAAAALSRLSAAADSAAQIPDAAVKEIYRELDQVYRVVKGQSKKLRPVIGDTQTIDDLADHLKSVLQRDDVWGSAAKSHKALTEAADRADKAATAFREHFPADSNGKVSRDKLLAFTKQIDRVQGEPRIQAMQEWIDAQGRLAETSGHALADTGRGWAGRELTKKYGEVYERMRRDALTLNAQDRLLAANRAHGIIPGMALGAGLASMGLGPAGFAAGNAVGNLVLNPGRSARTLAAMGAFRNKVAEAIDAKLSYLIEGTKRPVERLAYKVPEVVQRMVDGSPEERADAYREHVEQMAAVSEPEAYVNHIAPQLAPIAEAMPQHASAITAKGQQIQSYLAAERPPVQRPHAMTAGNIMALVQESRDAANAKVKPKWPTPSPAEIRKYGQTVEIAAGGTPAFLAAMEKGLTADQVRAFKALYPHQDAQLRQQLLTKLPSAKNLTPAVKRSLQVYFQAAGGDAQLRQMRQGIFQAEAAGQNAPQQVAPPSSGGTQINILTSPTDRLQNFPTQ